MASASSATLNSSFEVVDEVIERKWQVVDFLRLVDESANAHLVSFGRSFFVFGCGEKSATPRYGGRGIRAEASLSYMDEAVSLNLCLLDRPLGPSCLLKIIGASIRILADEEGTSALKELKYKYEVDWSSKDFVYPLFDDDEAEKYVGKNGALNIACKVTVAISRPAGSSCDPKCSQSQVCNDFEALLTDSSVADFEVKVCGKEGKSFFCHKAVLAARSSVFRGMFQSEMKESTENVVEMKDISAKTMGHFLSFLYCGRFQDDSWIKSLPKLAMVADKYGVKSLVELCDERLIESVTCGNALAVGKLAERLGLSKALKDIRDFTAMNIRKVTFDCCEDFEEED